MAEVNCSGIKKCRSSLAKGPDPFPYRTMGLRRYILIKMVLNAVSVHHPLTGKPWVHGTAINFQIQEKVREF